MAMTMAENEIWVDAINWQRGTIEGARELGVDPAMLEWLNSNLARYEQNEPARMPWSPYHTLFQPGGPPQPENHHTNKHLFCIHGNGGFYLFLPNRPRQGDIHKKVNKY